MSQLKPDGWLSLMINLLNERVLKKTLVSYEKNVFSKTETTLIKPLKGKVEDIYK